MTQESYSEWDRERAVAAYVATGMYTKASKMVGIPVDTIRSWHRRHSEWWMKIEERERALFEEEQRGYLTEIRTESAKAVLDRLKKGDEKLLRDGTKTRVKIGGRDAAVIYGVATDKMRISLGQPTSIQGKADSTANRLQELREAAKGPKTEGNVTYLEGSLKGKE